MDETDWIEDIIIQKGMRIQIPAAMKRLKVMDLKPGDVVAIKIRKREVK